MQAAREENPLSREGRTKPLNRSGFLVLTVSRERGARETRADADVSEEQVVVEAAPRKILTLREGYGLTLGGQPYAPFA